MIRALLLLLALETTAGAAPSLTADIGTLARGDLPGSWLVITNAVNASYSFGRATIASAVSGPFQLAFTARRLDADGFSVELWLPGGGVILLRDHEISIWFDDATWQGWQRFPAYRSQLAARFEVTQTKDAVELRVDGASMRWPIPASTTPGRLAVGFKAAPRRRARLRVVDVSFAQGLAPRQ